MKKIKRVVICLFVFTLSILLVACGNSTNANVANKINRTMNNLHDSIKNIQVIKEDELIVQDIMPTNSKTYTQTNAPEKGNVATRQIVNYNNGVANNNLSNVNTYNPYGRLHNTNSYVGYGEINNGTFNEIGHAQYGYGNFGLPNGYGANGYGIDGYQNQFAYGTNGQFGYNRGISNVNTYGIGKTNVNTYKKAKNVSSQINDSNLNLLEYNKVEPLTQYFSKLSNLYNVASSVVTTNNELNQIRNNILANISLIQTFANQIKNNKYDLTENQIKSINNLLDNINTNVNRINLSRNEVKNELNSVKNLKTNYTGNVEQLSSKYVRLVNCLDTRMTYFNNILGCLNQLENCLNGCDNCENSNIYNSIFEDVLNIPQNNNGCVYDENGNCIKYNYDQNGKCIGFDCFDKNGNCVDKYCYDENGNCVRCEDKNTTKINYKKTEKQINTFDNFRNINKNQKNINQNRDDYSNAIKNQKNLDENNKQNTNSNEINKTNDLINNDNKKINENNEINFPKVKNNSMKIDNSILDKMENEKIAKFEANARPEFSKKPNQDDFLKFAPRKKDISTIRPLNNFDLEEEKVKEIKLENGKTLKYYSEEKESEDGSIKTGQFYLWY